MIFEYEKDEEVQRNLNGLMERYMKEYG